MIGRELDTIRVVVHRLLLLLIVPGLVLAAERKAVTLDVAARLPAQTGTIGTPVWAPDGRSFAYLSGSALWLYNVESNQRRQILDTGDLTKAAVAASQPQPFHWENRRVQHDPVQWFPDGKALLLRMGGDVFVHRIENDKWEQLTATPQTEDTPALSPDGSAVAFERDNELYVLDIASRTTRRLTNDSTATLWNARPDWVYPEELDLGTALWWSPDSKRIAFLQFDVSREQIYPHADLLAVRAMYEPQRYPKAGTPNADVRVGVVAASGGAVTWLSLGDPRDALFARVRWLPDSSRVSVQRLNRVQNTLTLLFAEASTGQAREVLTERSPHWVNVSHDLRFRKKREEFVWSSEQSGYRHLYVYDFNGKQLRRLTEGDWAVNRLVTVDEERGLVYYESHERGPLGLDLASVPINGGKRRIITESKGKHSVSISPTAAHFIDTFHNLSQPSRKTLHKINGDRVAVLQPPNPAASEYEYVTPEIVEVKTPDGALLYGRMVKPLNFDRTKKYPAVVMVYGGPHAQSVCDCYGGMSWTQALAQRGFVVWELDNRGTAGRGLAWETKLYRRLGKQELEDQETGIKHLVSLGFVDPERIGMYGWSYGGFMTMYTLLHAPGLIRAGIAGAPVTDWRNYDTIYTERYLGLPQENEEGYRLSSPVHQASNLKAALMLVHNFEDDNVLFQNTMQMAVALQNAGKPFDLQVYPQKSHGVSGAARKHLLEATTAFFERHLK